MTNCVLLQNELKIQRKTVFKMIIYKCTKISIIRIAKLQFDNTIAAKDVFLTYSTLSIV